VALYPSTYACCAHADAQRNNLVKQGTAMLRKRVWNRGCIHIRLVMGCSTTHVMFQWAASTKSNTNRATCKFPAATDGWLTSPNGKILERSVVERLIHTHELHTGAHTNKLPAFMRRTTARIDLRNTIYYSSAILQLQHYNSTVHQSLINAVHRSLGRSHNSLRMGREAGSAIEITQVVVVPDVNWDGPPLQAPVVGSPNI
jgi:hypothetical protein